MDQICNGHLSANALDLVEIVPSPPLNSTISSENPARVKSFANQIGKITITIFNFHPPTLPKHLCDGARNPSTFPVISRTFPKSD